MLAQDRFPRRVDATDGLGNTLMVSEAAGQPEEWMRGRRTGSSVLPENAVLAARDNDFSLRGFTWDAATQRYSNVHSGPCAINCSNIKGVYSFHHGGAQAVFGDGSVRFLRQDVSTFFWLASSRAPAAKPWTGMTIDVGRIGNPSFLRTDYQ
ncbi:MAG: DUF1559 domain-containing protein, partial [Gemmataceae bacterium]